MPAAAPMDMGTGGTSFLTGIASVLDVSRPFQRSRCSRMAPTKKTLMALMNVTPNWTLPHGSKTTSGRAKNMKMMHEVTSAPT
jgi:hypothetical protein